MYLKIHKTVKGRNIVVVAPFQQTGYLKLWGKKGYEIETERTNVYQLSDKITLDQVISCGLQFFSSWSRFTDLRNNILKPHLKLVKPARNCISRKSGFIVIYCVIIRVCCWHAQI